MLKILINSYTCCPNMGSEQGMGWNWITHLARHCELFVISEGEYREQCEAASKQLPIHWYWNPVPQSTRDKCWNQGNWLFYPLYRQWQKKTAAIAAEICRREKIDILHQLNMIGFREPGYLAQVSKQFQIPLVWGPIGGLKQFPLAFADGGGLKMKVAKWLKNKITLWQIQHDKRVIYTLHQSALLLSSIPDSYHAIKRFHGLESVIIPETGCAEITSDLSSPSSDRFHRDTLDVLWVGKLDFRKRLDIALKALAQTKNRQIRLTIYGTGNTEQLAEANQLVRQLNLDAQVVFKGSCSNDEVIQAMRTADLFLFTSVEEDTSTVVLEAISNLLPVLCFDACGMANVIDQTVGHKVALSHPQQAVADFAEWLQFAFSHRDQLETWSSGCKSKRLQYSWESKINQLLSLYQQL